MFLMYHLDSTLDFAQFSTKRLKFKRDIFEKKRLEFEILIKNFTLTKILYYIPSVNYLKIA